MGTAFVFFLLAVLAICGAITAGLVVLHILDDAKRSLEHQEMLRELKNRAAHEK